MRAGPALCPGRVLIDRIPLDQTPSLRFLRSRFRGLVRRLRQYYGASPVSGLSLSGTAPDAIRRGRYRDLLVLARKGSARVTGLRPPRGRPRARILALGTCRLPPCLNDVGAREGLFSRLNTAPVRAPINASLIEALGYQLSDVN